MSWFLINLDFILPHIAHFDNIITLTLLLAETFGSMFSVFFYTSNNMISFYTYALFIKIMSSFFWKLFGEKRFVYFDKVFPLNMKSINSIQKYPHITESYACIPKMFVLMFFIVNKCFNFFWNVFYTKRIKISNIVIHMESNPMSFNIRVLIKIS